MNIDDSGCPSELLIELTSLDELSFPTSSTSRIRFTCLAAASHSLAVGSTSGTVYLYSRYASKYRKSLTNVPVQLITCKDGAIEQLAFSPNQKLLAIASSGGSLCIANVSNSYPTVVLTSNLHCPNNISCICWTQDNSTLYLGDVIGKLSKARISGRTVFRAACDVVINVDSEIVQLDCYDKYVLISSITRTFIYQIQSNNLIPVGTKPRSGKYGSCFAFPGQSEPVVFCGRPGGRLWECDMNGRVYNTHHFKQLTTPPLCPVVSYRYSFDVTMSLRPQTLHLSHIYVVQDNLVVFNGSYLYVFDIKRARISLICDCKQEIYSCCVSGCDIFLLTREGGLRKLSLYDTRKALDKIILREYYLQAAQLVTTWPLFKWNASTLHSLKSSIITWCEANESNESGLNVTKETLDNLNRNIANICHNIGEHEESVGKPYSVRHVPLAGGMLRVHRVMVNSGYDDDFTFRAPSPRNVKRRNRSRSIEPSERHRTLSKEKDMTLSRSQDSLLTLLDDQVWINNAYLDSSSESVVRSSNKELEGNEEEVNNCIDSQVVVISRGRRNKVKEETFEDITRNIAELRAKSEDAQFNCDDRQSTSTDVGIDQRLQNDVIELVDVLKSDETMLAEDKQRSLMVLMQLCRLFYELPLWIREQLPSLIPLIPKSVDEWIKYILDIPPQSVSPLVATSQTADSLNVVINSGSKCEPKSPVANPLLSMDDKYLEKIFAQSCSKTIESLHSPVGFVRGFNPEGSRKCGEEEYCGEESVLVKYLPVVRCLHGVNAMLHVLQNENIADRMTIADWTQVMRIINKHKDEFDALPPQLLVSILCNLGLKVRLPTDESIKQTSAIIPSVIDLRDLCPCCSLPLATNVSPNQNSLMHYKSCGHNVHSVCLTNYVNDMIDVNAQICVKCQQI